MTDKMHPAFLCRGEQRCSFDRTGISRLYIAPQSDGESRDSSIVSICSSAAILCILGGVLASSLSDLNGVSFSRY